MCRGKQVHWEQGHRRRRVGCGQRGRGGRRPGRRRSHALDVAGVAISGRRPRSSAGGSLSTSSSPGRGIGLPPGRSGRQRIRVSPERGAAWKRSIRRPATDRRTARWPPSRGACHVARTAYNSKHMNRCSGIEHRMHAGSIFSAWMRRRPGGGAVWRIQRYRSGVYPRRPARRGTEPAGAGEPAGGNRVGGLSPVAWAAPDAAGEVRPGWAQGVLPDRR